MILFFPCAFIECFFPANMADTQIINFDNRRTVVVACVDKLTDVIKRASGEEAAKCAAQMTALAGEFGFLYGKMGELEAVRELANSKDGIIAALQAQIATLKELVDVLKKQSPDALRKAKEHCWCRYKGECDSLVAGKPCSFRHSDEDRKQAVSATPEKKLQALQRLETRAAAAALRPRPPPPAAPRAPAAP